VTAPDDQALAAWLTMSISNISFSWEGSDNPNDPSGVACFKVGRESVTVGMDNFAQAAKLERLIEKACDITKQLLLNRATDGISLLLKGYRYD
jgi:hypothetical protein